MKEEIKINVFESFNKNEKLDSECLENAKKIIEDFESKDKRIGEGKTAFVLESELDEDICLKLVFDTSISSNDVEKEARFNDELFKKKISVPVPVCHSKTSEREYFFQEKIKGISLQQLVEENRIEDLPASFEFSKFFSKLNQEVKKMNDFGYHHRDLHLGNVMVDESGDPVIIDFGDAVKDVMDSEDPYRYIDSKGEIQVKPKDAYRVGQNRALVGEYLKRNGWFKK